MQMNTVFGQTIRYYERGSGPTCVLLHGIASDALLDWGKVITPLAATHHVLALDQIGFGSSDKPKIEYRIQTFVDFLGEFLRQREIKQFALAGVSLGGWIAAQYVTQALMSNGASRFPVPERLLLCDAAGLRQDFPPGLLATLLPGSLADQKASLDGLVYDRTLVNEETVRNEFALRLAAQDGQTIRSLVASFPKSTEWVNGILRSITIPTLIVWGAEDLIMPLAHGWEFAAGIPNSRLIVIDHCGHAPMVEKPSEFLAAVDGFL
jgi:pimeloyl-ACP methyl ester carboxylesterase